MIPTETTIEATYVWKLGTSFSKYHRISPRFRFSFFHRYCVTWRIWTNRTQVKIFHYISCQTLLMFVCILFFSHNFNNRKLTDVKYCLFLTFCDYSFRSHAESAGKKGNSNVNVVKKLHFTVTQFYWHNQSLHSM